MKILYEILFVMVVIPMVILVVHEGGHYIASKVMLKKGLKFKKVTTEITIKVLRFIWELPTGIKTPLKKFILAISGFLMEISIGVFWLIIDKGKGFSVVYLGAVLVHMWVYWRMYKKDKDNVVGRYNDFRLMKEAWRELIQLREKEKEEKVNLK